VATQADVRRIALALPGAVEDPDRFAFSVPHKGKLKGFAWVWLERPAPKQARVPQPKVLAVRVANLAEKDLMLQLEPERFFTESHYNGYPAVLVHLPLVSVGELRPILEEAWRCQAPKELTGAKAARRPRPGGPT
jgi:hypothetical protein